MFKILKEHHRFTEIIFMSTISSLCFGLSLFRFLYTDSKLFLFLNWNLFLAFVPWALSLIAVINPNVLNRKILIIALFIMWLLFFPNALYILTDLFQLHNGSPVPMWFDLVLILFFAWTGLLFGFLSLWDLERILEKYLSRNWITLLSIGLLFLGSFGIYLGRYLRWNSWDIIRDPFGLFYDIGKRLAFPTEHPSTWGMTIFWGIFLNVMYWSFRLVKARK